MLNLKRVDHYTIHYPQGEEKTLFDFYEIALELNRIESLVDGAIWFKIGLIELHFTIGITQPKESRHIAFEVEDLEECKSFLLKKNIPIENTSKIEGRERFFFRDPFGNRFELVEYISE